MISFEGNFTRKSPAEFSKNGHLLPGWFVVSHRWVDEKKSRRLVHAKWCKITLGDQKIFRIIRFSTNLKGSLKSRSGDIVLDWQGWLQLNNFDEDVQTSLKLKIERVRWYHAVFLPMSHPDPTMQLSGFLGLLSMVLGLVSLALGIISLMMV